MLNVFTIDASIGGGILVEFSNPSSGTNRPVFEGYLINEFRVNGRGPFEAQRLSTVVKPILTVLESMNVK